MVAAAPEKSGRRALWARGAIFSSLAAMSSWLFKSNDVPHDENDRRRSGRRIRFPFVRRPKRRGRARPRRRALGGRGAGPSRRGNVRVALLTRGMSDATTLTLNTYSSFFCFPVKTAFFSVSIFLAARERARASHRRGMKIRCFLLATLLLPVCDAHGHRSAFNAAVASR